LIWSCSAFLAPVLADGVIETQFSPKQSLRELHRLTFWLGMLIPSVLTGFPVIRTLYMLICLIVNFDRFAFIILPFVVCHTSKIEINAYVDLRWFC
jgi:hypothetical protein